MANDVTTVAGIPIPSVSPAFLAGVAFHVLAGLACTVAGLMAMLSSKGPGRHASFGRIYYRCLAAVFASASALAVVRWTEDYDLFVLGAASFAAAHAGRTALSWPSRNSLRMHAVGMGASYILLLTAFYVDNGKSLPFWKQFPQIAFWLLPSAIGAPILLYVMLLHPLTRTARRVAS